VSRCLLYLWCYLVQCRSLYSEQSSSITFIDHPRPSLAYRSIRLLVHKYSFVGQQDERIGMFFCSLGALGRLDCYVSLCIWVLSGIRSCWMVFVHRWVMPPRPSLDMCRIDVFWRIRSCRFIVIPHLPSPSLCQSPLTPPSCYTQIVPVIDRSASYDELRIPVFIRSMTRLLGIQRRFRVQCSTLSFSVDFAPFFSFRSANSLLIFLYFTSE